MAIVQTINSFGEFYNAFKACNREDNFTPYGLRLIWDYFEDSAQEQNIELDVIGICCDYNECTCEEIAQDYKIDLSDCETEEQCFHCVLQFLHNQTIVIGKTSTTIIYAAF